ncbi:BspA family leucine-rich repeat surface protein [Amylibacter sp.]|nr:BspA family leucine-rich repeat surface protein [Amylibacter sp.]
MIKNLKILCIFSICAIANHTLAETLNFSFTGASETFTVPDGVTELDLYVRGACGGGASGYNTSAHSGTGGFASGTLSVTAGTELYLYVGGKGDHANTDMYQQDIPGGWNGGGDSFYPHGSGGGASDIRVNGTNLTDRIVVGAGGGGTQGTGGYTVSLGGGNGGGLTGSPGKNGGGNPAAGGGTQSSGGTSTSYGSPYKSFIPGTFGLGADGSDDNTAGGGGGYFGGGTQDNSSAGGGSSYVGSLNNSGTGPAESCGISEPLYNIGYDGLISISYITPTNNAPSASAGANQSVASATIVTLDATGSSDPDVGDILTYSWSQTVGTNVTLSDDTAAQPTFTAPILGANDAAETLTFSLLVTDDKSNASAIDTVNITINPPVALNDSTFISAIQSCLNEEPVTGLCTTYGDSTGYGVMPAWDTSQITDATQAFYNYSSFNGDISQWDVSSVKEFGSTFWKTTNFNQDISSWDVSSATKMKNMFREANAFNQDISTWDVSSVTDMDNMFLDNTGFNNGGVSLNWSDTSSVTNMARMFEDSSFNQDISSWNTSSVTTMAKMFMGASSFNQDVRNWNTSNVIWLNGMFLNSTSFNQDIRGWDVNKVDNFNSMFNGATAMISNFGTTANWNTTPTSAWFASETTSPTMTISAVAVNSGDTSNDTTLALTFISTEATTDFDKSDISVTNGTLSNFAGSGTTYTATFTPTSDGATTIDVLADTFTDPAGNNNNAATKFTWTYDATSPTMTISAVAVNSGDTSNDTTLALTFISTEATTDFDKSDISVTNGTLSNFAGSGTTYTATFTPTSDGATTIDVLADTFTDPAGNNNNAATKFTWTYDATSPTMFSVNITTNNIITSVANNGDIVTLTFTTSEAISKPVVAFKSGGAAITDTSITYVNIIGSTWAASYIANANDTFGAVTFSITYSDIIGNEATATSTTDSSSVSFMPLSSAAFAAVKADIESKMAANARTQLNQFSSSVSSMMKSARSRFIDKAGVVGGTDSTLSADISSEHSNLIGSNKGILTSDDGKNISILEIQYQYTETKEGLKSQNASGQMINETRLSDALTFGRFFGASLGDGGAIGANSINIDFIGAQAGTYLAGNTKGGLVYSTYFAGSIIENKMGITDSLLQANSKYYSSMLTSGAAVTGSIYLNNLEIRPTLSTDISYMFGETIDFIVSVGSDTSVEQATYGDITKAQITFAPELRLPVGKSSTLSATHSVKCRYLKQGTSTENCGQGLLLGFGSTTKDALTNFTAKIGMDQIGNETTSTIKLRLEHSF